MRRREFIAGLALPILNAPRAVRAQQAARLPTVGFLGAATRAATATWAASFIEGLRDSGWTDGRNIAIEYRWAEGRTEPLPELAAELVRIKVDVIVTHATAPVLAAKRATSVIPLVFANAGDPVGNGLVASLARPGGNVTGLSIQGSDTVGKRLELLREAVPTLRRLAVMGNVENAAVVSELKEVEVTARSVGIEVVVSELRRADDIEPAFQQFVGKADALYVGADALAIVNRVRINTNALSARLPTVSSVGAYVEAGALIAYGANFPDLWRRAAHFVDKILKGAKPADLPVEQPTKFDLVINRTTAQLLGVELSPTLLARADEVIE